MRSEAVVTGGQGEVTPSPPGTTLHSVGVEETRGEAGLEGETQRVPRF